MTDLFVGEILVLTLLLPVLFRPFFRRLQRIGGLALFPLLAFLLCLAIVAAVGLKISFLPVLFFSIVVLLAGLGRLFRLFRNLPTDLYSPSLVVFHGFLLIVFLCVTGLSFYTAPESAYISRQDVRKSIVEKKISSGVQVRIRTWVPPASAKTKGIVLFEGDVACLANSRPTAAAILAENGYIVVAADFRTAGAYEMPLLNLPSFRSVSALSSRVISGVSNPVVPEEAFAAQTDEVNLLVSIIRARYGNALPLYAVAEGSACAPVLSRAGVDPRLFTGTVCIVHQSQLAALGAQRESSLVLEEGSGMMPANAGSWTACILTGPNLSVFGTGELSCDDILATLLSGSARDENRKKAEITARRISSWIEMRGAYENK